MASENCIYHIYIPMCVYVLDVYKVRRVDRVVSSVAKVQGWGRWRGNGVYIERCGVSAAPGEGGGHRVCG